MSRSLRIAVFTGTFPVISETFILRQITGLIELGHEVDIFADTRPDAVSPQQPEIAKHRLLDRTIYMDMPLAAAPWEMPVWPIGGRTWLPGEAKPITNISRIIRALPTFIKALAAAPRLTAQALRRSCFGFQASSLSTLYRLARLCSISKRYDILHAHFGPVANSYRFAPTLFGAPFVASFHGFDVSSIPKQSGDEVYRRLFQQTDAVTANSDAMAADLARLGCPSARLHKLNYGLDLSQFPARAHSRNSGEPGRVLTVGRLVEKKGLEYSIRAFATVRQRGIQATYDVVGDGPLRPKLQQLADELHLSGAISFHGALDGARIRHLLSNADVFVLASVTAADGDREGTPVSLLEAQASSVPIIATRHSGIPEIMIDGQTGFLVPERDVDQLADRLTFLVTHPEIGAGIGAKGRTFVTEHFRHDHVLQRLVEDIYRPLVRTPAFGRPG